MFPAPSARPASSLALLILLAAGADTRAASGQVLLSGATVDSGSSPVAKGAVIIDPAAADAAPPADPDPAVAIDLGPAAAPPPAFPTNLPGGAAFHATADTSLPGGTIDVSTFTVDKNVTVFFAGPVTIRATGNVTLDGALHSLAADASITILCGGDFTVNRPATSLADLILASGARSDVVLDVGGTLLIDDGRKIEAARDIRIVQHKPQGSATLKFVSLLADAGAVDVLAASTLSSFRVGVTAPKGTLTVRTFATSLFFEGATIAAKGVTLDGATYVSAIGNGAWTVDGPVTLAAHSVGVDVGETS